MPKASGINREKPNKELVALSSAIQGSLQPLMTKSGYIDADTDRLFDAIGYRKRGFYDDLDEGIKKKIAYAAENVSGKHWGLPPVDAFTDKSKWPKNIILMANQNDSVFYFVDDRSQGDKSGYVAWTKLWFEGDDIKLRDINHDNYSMSLASDLAHEEAMYQLAIETRDKATRTTRVRIN